ncbi:MAG: hypothetical protein IJS81_02045 [Selenomonadaceae bacterium]|nr:hypothetical protein [Selenomonadaceae bacterium]
MIRKFLAAVILVVFMLSAQIAAAEDYDWSKAPRIGSKAELARYVENGRRRGQTEFNFVLTYVNVTNQQELNTLAGEFAGSIAPAPKAVLTTSFGSGQFTYKIHKEYPGIHVANAYRDHLNYDDRAFNELKTEEKQLYNIAVGIVYEANKRQSEVEKARYIHDEICRRVREYQSHTNEDATGALIIGVTNCQGFADAFYMLGRMSGLKVGRIHGTLDGTSHAWNWITFSDGKTYCVDVTNGFNTKTQYLFLATRERIEKAGWWCEWSIIPNLQ